MTKAHMQATIKDMRQKLSSVGNDAQLANVDHPEHAPEIAADLADDFERVQDASRHGYGNHPQNRLGAGRKIYGPPHPRSGGGRSPKMTKSRL